MPQDRPHVPYRLTCQGSLHATRPQVKAWEAQWFALGVRETLAWV